MPKRGKITPPIETAGDGAHAAVKSVLGAIPLVGSAVNEAFNLFVRPPVEKRKQEWMDSVVDSIYQLEGKGISIDDLQNNEEFIDIVMYATQAAIRTSQKEKLKAYKNAILNSALPNPPDVSQQQIFLNYLDDFTIWHLKILDLFSNPQGWLNKNDIEFDVSRIVMGNLTQIVEKAFQELSGRKDFYSQVGKDLTNGGLANLNSFSGSMTGGGLLAKRTTEFGDSFLKFISD